MTKLKKTQIVTKLKTQIVTKLKLRQNSSCDKTQILTEHKFWQNSSCDKIKIFTQYKLWRKKLKNQNATKLKLWQNLRTQIMTKIKQSNCDKNQNLKLWGKKTGNMTNLNLWEKI